MQEKVPTWRLGETSVERLATVSREERARMLTLPRERETHASLLARMPFVDCVEVAQPPLPPASPPPRARIVAWNAERGRHLEGAAAFLRGAEADACLLSELDLGMARSGQRHTARELARVLGCGYAFAVEFLELGLGDDAEKQRCAGQENAVGYHGGALITRHPVRRPGVVRMEARGDWWSGTRGQRRVGGRIAVLGTLRLGEADVTLAAVHLDSHGDPEQRARELEGLLAALDVYAPGQPALVGGDLNTHTFSAAQREDPDALRAALEEHPERLRDPVSFEPLFAQAAARGFAWQPCNVEGASTQRTARGPGALKLDWFLARGLRACEPQVIAAVDPSGGGVLSDHEALAVTIEPLPPPSA